MELYNHGRHQSQLISLARIEHMLQDQLEIGLFQQRIKNSTNRSRRRSGFNPAAGATVYWSYKSYSLPIGSLQVEDSRMCQSNSSEGSSVQEFAESKVKIKFGPPRWMSSIALEFALEFRHNCHGSWPGLSVSLTPFTVNYNPLLSKAIEEGDVAGLQKLFRDGLARPTDYVPECGFWSYGPMSLLEVGSKSYNITTAC